MKITLLTRLTVGYIAILFLVILLGVYVAFNLNQLSRLIRGTAANGMTINNLVTFKSCGTDMFQHERAGS